MGHIWPNNGTLPLRAGKSRRKKAGEDIFSIYLTVNNLTKNGLQGVDPRFHEYKSTLKVKVNDSMKKIEIFFSFDFLLFLLRGT